MTDIATLGTILAIWAHPDDETWCAAGIMAAAVANGQPVVCVTATRGEAGVTDPKRWPPAQLGQIREKELSAALKVLGVTRHHWLDFIDGECSQVQDEVAIAKLVPLIEATQPDTVLTFGPDGMTGHPDHQTVGRWTEQALSQASLHKPAGLYHFVISQEWYEHTGQRTAEQFDVFFNIDQPPLRPEAEMDIQLRLTGPALARKLEALAAHASQSTRLIADCPPDELQAMMACEGFMLAGKFGPS